MDDVDETGVRPSQHLFPSGLYVVAEVLSTVAHYTKIVAGQICWGITNRASFEPSSHLSSVFMV